MSQNQCHLDNFARVSFFMISFFMIAVALARGARCTVNRSYKLKWLQIDRHRRYALFLNTGREYKQRDTDPLNSQPFNPKSLTAVAMELCWNCSRGARALLASCSRRICLDQARRVASASRKRNDSNISVAICIVRRQNVALVRSKHV